MSKNYYPTMQTYFKAFAFATLSLLTFYAFGAGDTDMVEKLGDTAKSLISGKAALVIDAIIIGAAGFGAATLRSPAPIIFGLISVGLFHVAVKWITGA